LGKSESLLNVRGGHGHAVAGLVASPTRTAVGAQALEKRSRQIDAAAGCGVSFGRATGIREKRSVGDESNLLSAYRNNDRQHRN